MMKKEFFKTKDGSFTLFIPEMNETYHSKFGAVNEAKHVFIKAGLQALKKPEIQLLEVGFGTGLNAFLSLKYLLSDKTLKKIYYHSLEKYPLEKKFLSDLNYTSNLKEKAFFDQLHSAEWNMPVEILPGFVLFKQQMDLQNFHSNTYYDLIYFDAFAPNKQPELWTQEIFDNLYRHMNPSGVLVTYSAKGQVRRNMQAAGFMVERLPGPPGKREMLRAVKK